MTLALYAHPFSSYSQKVLIALYENDISFEFRMLGPDHPQFGAQHEKLWPLKRFPVLVDGEAVFRESSIIIEYLHIRYPGPVRMLPSDPMAALEVRFLDRFFDNYVMDPVQRIVMNSLRPEAQRDSLTVETARAALETAYGWINETLADRQWAAGDDFTLADCAAAPALFYADWTHPIGEQWPNLKAYRQRLLGRASFARAVDEARPYRPLFPLGAPDRD